MAGSRKPIPGMGSDSLADRLKNSLGFDEKKDDKRPDFRELNQGSPVSTLRNRMSGLSSTTASATATATATTTSTTTSSSTSSPSGSVTGRNVSSSGTRNCGSSHSGEFSGSVESSPTSRGVRSGYGRSNSRTSNPSIYSDGTSVTSPAVNIFPTGNICRAGTVFKAGLATKPKRSSVLGSGTGNYGYGTIMRGTYSPKYGGSGIDESVGELRNDAEELKRMGNENYKKGKYAEALNLYDKAIAISPENAPLHFNRSAALIGLKQLGEAMKECEEAIKFDPTYVRPHQRLASLSLTLGQVEKARSHFFSLGQKPAYAELQKLEAVEKHIKKCTDARRLGDWKSTLKEAEAATASGAEESPQLFACRAEAYLKLHQVEDAEFCLASFGNYEPSVTARQSNNFGMVTEAYIFFVQAQVHMALGWFENALTAIERAAQLDPRSAEITVVLKNVTLVGRARARGNDLFRSERYTEALVAYDDGLMRDSSNSILYCNRAACWYKLGKWEKSLDDCNKALLFRPHYAKAILRRAASNAKLERWAAAVRDYEVLRRELPYDNEVAESLFHAQVALKKSRGEVIHNMKFGGEVELVSSIEQFRDAILCPDASVVHFKEETNLQCKQISTFVDTLSIKFPSVSFLKVDVEETPAIAKEEKIITVPTFKIYKNGKRMKEMVCPSPEVLESSVRHYSI